MLAANAVLQAQTTTQQPRLNARSPGTIVDTPSSGKITDAPLTSRPPAPRRSKGDGDLAGQKIERFEAVGNTHRRQRHDPRLPRRPPGRAVQPRPPAAQLPQPLADRPLRRHPHRGRQGESGRRGRSRHRQRAAAHRLRRVPRQQRPGHEQDHRGAREGEDRHPRRQHHRADARSAAPPRRSRRPTPRTATKASRSIPSTETWPTPGEKQIVFNINEGIKAKVASIDFTGNKHFSVAPASLGDERSEDPQHRLLDPEEGPLHPVEARRGPRAHQELLPGLRLLRRLVRRAAGRQVGRDTKKPRVQLVIPVKEGTVHTFGDVSVTGNTVFTNQQLIGELAAQEGRDHPPQADPDPRRRLRRGVPHARLHLRVREPGVRRASRATSST